MTDPDETLEPDDDSIDLLDEVAEALELTTEETEAVAAFAFWASELHEHDHDGNGRPGDDVIVAQLLPYAGEIADAAVAEALRIVSVHGDRHDGEYLAEVLRPLVAEAPRKALPSMHWLLGHIADLNNDVDAAQAAYERVAELDPEHPLAMNDLAAIRSERGDAVGAQSLLSRLGEDADESLVAMVEPYQPVSRSDLGRNDPCFCGSGRKYKVCHLGRAEFSLAERADWLYEKVAFRVQRNEYGQLIAGLAEVRAELLPGDDALDEAMDDPLIIDTTMFEGGGLRSFLEERGQVLPDDELELGTSWLSARRSVFEVEDADAGGSFALRDVQSGERHVVSGDAASLRVGLLVSARLLESSGEPRIPAGLEPVPAELSEKVLSVLAAVDVDPVDLVESLSARFALSAPGVSATQ